MAQLHFAYAFDIPALAAPLRSALAQGGLAQLTAELKRRAADAVHRPSPTLREAMEAVRYSAGWLDDNSEEADLPAKRFLLCILANAVSVPSLGRRGDRLHHLILKSLLPDNRWSPAEVNRLLRGDPLYSLLNEMALADARQTLSGIDDLGGWLGAAGASHLRAGLERARSARIDYGRQRHADLHAVAPDWEANSTAVAEQSLERAIEMLSHANDANHALFLVLD